MYHKLMFMIGTIVMGVEALAMVMVLFSFIAMWIELLDHKIEQASISLTTLIIAIVVAIIGDRIRWQCETYRHK